MITDYRKSSYSELHGVLNCVEVGTLGGLVAVRDTQQAGTPDRAVLTVDGPAWQAFLARLA